MNEIKWHDRFKIGVDEIDKSHQRLFSIVAKILNLNEDEDKQSHACREGIKYFKSYALRHFHEEEVYMKSIDYGEYDLHKSLHDNMRNITIPALEAELESENYSTEAVRHFLGLCIGWLEGHIMIEDRAIVGKTGRKWIHMPSQDETVSLEKALIQTINDLFRVKAGTISKHYGGENFTSGNSLCFRLTYSAADKKTRRVYIIYEENMVLRALSDILGKNINKADRTVIYAVQAVSRQLVDCVGKHFTIGLDFDKSDLLTFEQFVNTFEKDCPPYSFLFNMENKGYLAFCVR